MGPLAGIKILDLSRVLAGPWATQTLADLGADVVKVERPQAGDETRAWGPPYLKDREARDTSESAYFLSTNRGKRSIAIDIASAGGQKLVRELALQSDVLIENFRVGTLKNYRLGWEDLAPLNARLIYCSISAFGQTGPHARESGYDAMIQGMGGLMSITGVPDGEPGAGPQKVGVAVADLMTGLYAVIAIVAALYERERSGTGQYIDLALLDTQLACLANQALGFLVSGRPPHRRGSAHPSIVPYQAFAAADAYLMLAVGNDRQFAAFCEVAGEPALARDVRFATNTQRVAHREILVRKIADLLMTRSARDWIGALSAAGVPCGPINDVGQALAEPQARAREVVISLPHALGVPAPGVRNPIRYSRTPLEHQLPPPLLGEHTSRILAERLGLAEAQIAALRAERIVA
ncbi:MAG TPA: CaiB/BaiF CoA-transferase family protein [Steroidobacteraceae bacterium]|nr:CaiB/BaiF CoA-transferase family protein [Steroidobacteraceae bacterium]